MGDALSDTARQNRERVYHPLAPLESQLAKWRGEISSRRVRDIFDRAADGIDRAAYLRLQQAYHEEAERADDRDPIKYLDIAPWLVVHARVAAFIGIDEGPPRSILDIGAGGGQFLAIAKAFGHEVTALDLADPPIYRDLLDLFGIDCIEGGVRFGKPLPDQVGRYDLIVIHGQIFDVDPVTLARWDVPEWAAFIEYLTARHLRFPGEFFLGLNRSAGPSGNSDYLWSLIELAAEHGARTDPEKPFMHFRLEAPPAFEDANGFSWLEADAARKPSRDSTKAT